MVRRILRSMKANGLVDAQPAPAVDMAEHARIARQIAEQGIVTLKNDGNAERKSVVAGKSVSVSVDLGGRRYLKNTISNKARQLTLPNIYVTHLIKTND